MEARAGPPVAGNVPCLVAVPRARFTARCSAPMIPPGALHRARREARRGETPKEAPSHVVVRAQRVAWHVPRLVIRRHESSVSHRSLAGAELMDATQPDFPAIYQSN